MTATTLAPSTAAGEGVSFANVVRSEWTKFWSLRSSWWTLLATFGVTVGFTTLFAWGITSSYDDWDASDKATFDPTSAGLGGLLFGQLAIAVLGVLMVSGEYSTGGVKATFIAVPQRLKVLGAKALVLLVVSLVVGLVSCFLSYFIAQLFFASKDIESHLGDPGVLRAVIGGGLFIAGCGLFGLAVATVVRHSAGSITTVVALLFVLPLMSNLLPGTVGENVTKFFTTNAGQHITDVRDVSDALSPWAGFGVFTLEWLLILLLGSYLLQKRDA